VLRKSTKAVSQDISSAADAITLEYPKHKAGVLPPQYCVLSLELACTLSGAVLDDVYQSISDALLHVRFLQKCTGM